MNVLYGLKLDPPPIDPVSDILSIDVMVRTVTGDVRLAYYSYLLRRWFDRMTYKELDEEVVAWTPK